MIRLWLHRAYMISVLPLVWALASFAYVVFGPIFATEEVWRIFKKNWRAQ